MRIILSGGGSGENTEGLDKEFAFFLDKSKPLLYIPLAINNKKHPYSECLRWLRLTFDNLGVSSYKMITDKNINFLSNKDPKDFAGIYIGGGNAPHLLKTIKETCLWSFLKLALKENVPIYGGSAGAVIFGKTIIPALLYDKNEIGLKDLGGFDILNGTEIACHYSKKEKQKVQRLIKENNMKKLIALTEKNGLLFVSGSLILIGKEEGFVFMNKKIKNILPREKIGF